MGTSFLFFCFSHSVSLWAGAQGKQGFCVLALAVSTEDMPATVAEEKVVIKHSSSEPGCCFSRSLFLLAPQSAILAQKSRSGFCFPASWNATGCGFSFLPLWSFGNKTFMFQVQALQRGGTGRFPHACLSVWWSSTALGSFHSFLLS